MVTMVDYGTLVPGCLIRAANGVAAGTESSGSRHSQDRIRNVLDVSAKAAKLLGRLHFACRARADEACVEAK